jgi:hypothetical protein
MPHLLTRLLTSGGGYLADRGIESLTVTAAGDASIRVEAAGALASLCRHDKVGRGRREGRNKLMMMLAAAADDVVVVDDDDDDDDDDDVGCNADDDHSVPPRSVCRSRSFRGRIRSCRRWAVT